MAARMTTEEFISKAVSVHGNWYDYSQVIYHNTNTPVTIICAKHGAFLQLPKIHLKMCHCPQCAIETHPSHSALSTNEFINRAMLTHGTKYNYSRVTYTNANTKVNIVCNTCGHTFNMVPAIHIYGQGCPKCGKVSSGKKHRLTQQEFVSRLRQRYGEQLDYTHVQFVKLSHKVTLICNLHNLKFSMRGDYLLDNTVSCPGCVRTLKKRPHPNRPPGPGKYHINRTTLDNTSAPALVYVLRLTSADEVFYKVGVTVQSTKQRLYHMKDSGYSIEVVHEFQTTLGEAIKEENRILRENKVHQYLPRIKFGGYTECLCINPYEGKPLINITSALPAVQSS